MSTANPLQRLFGDRKTISLSVGDALHLIANDRRRWAIEYIANRPDGSNIETDELTEAVSAREYGDYDATERKRIYIGMYQTHIPELVDAGVLHKVRANTFVKGPEAEGVGELIHRANMVIQG